MTFGKSVCNKMCIFILSKLVANGFWDYCHLEVPQRKYSFLCQISNHACHISPLLVSGSYVLVVLFWPGLKLGAGPSQLQIGQAKPSPDDGFVVALAGLPFWKAKAKPSGWGFSMSYIFTLYEHFIFYFYLFFMIYTPITTIPSHVTCLPFQPQWVEWWYLP